MYLYVIVDSTDQNCKIGYSRDPDRRCAELSVGNSSQLRVAHRARVDEDRARVLEKRVHFELGVYRTRGEWFHLPVARACGLVDFCIIRWHDDPLV